MVTTSQLQLITSAAQAVFAFGLLVATAIYTFYTQRQNQATRDQIGAMESQSKAARDQTEAMSKPYLKTTIEHPNFAESFFIIQNTGNGAAHDVEAEWEIGAEEERSWNIPLIPPGEKHRFVITKSEDGPVSGMKQIKDILSENGFELRFKANCSDIFENKHQFEETIDLEEAIWGRRDNSYEWIEKPLEQEIAEDISSVDSHLKSVGKVASALRREMSSIVGSYQKDQYIDRLERFGELSVDQISRLLEKQPGIVRTEVKILADKDILEFDEDNEVVRLENRSD